MVSTVGVVVAAVAAVIPPLIVFLYSRKSPTASRKSFSDKAIQTQGTSRFWDIPEIILLVVVQLPRHDQLSVILTCRFLRDLATPVLWRSLVGHRPSSQLFNILPKILSQWDYHFNADLIGRIVGAVEDPPSWGRLEFHRPLVKIFDLVLTGLGDQSVSVLRILQAVGKTPLFPRLEVLNITMSKPQDRPEEYMQCLLPPSLHTVRLRIKRTTSSDENNNHITAIIRFIHRVELKELHIAIPDSTRLACPHISKALTRAISSQHLLRRLVVLDLADRFLLPWSAASRLEHLRHVTFRESEAFPDPGHWRTYAKEVAVSRGFPALRTASLEVAGEGLHSVLLAITSTHLAELELVIQKPDASQESTPALDGRLAEITKFDGLTILQITFIGTTAEWGDFLPLLSCHLLETLILRGHRLSQAVGNEELDLMARSWTHLTQLEVVDSARTRLDAVNAAPRITLHGLTSLAKHCPQLQQLTINVDGRNPEPDPAFDFIGVVVQDVRLPFSLTNRDPESCELVARFITEMWPNQILPRTDELGRWARGRYDMNLGPQVVTPQSSSWQYIWITVYTSIVSSLNSRH